MSEDMRLCDYYKKTYGLKDMDDITHAALFLSVLNIPEHALPVYHQEVERMIELMGAEMQITAFAVAPPFLKRIIIFLLRCNSTCGYAPELTEPMMELLRKAEDMSKEYLHFMKNDPEIYGHIVSKHYEEGDYEAARAIWQEHRPQGDD